jgi:hypothetical protein
MALLIGDCFDPFFPETARAVSVGYELHLENSLAFIWAG